MNKRRFFEVATVAWALALVILGAVHLTAGTAEAESGWLDCGEACAVACGDVNSQCESVFDWFGCGCTVYCENGEFGDVYCI